MAERDGTIVIDTQIDTKGVDAGSEKTEASLRRMPCAEDVYAMAKIAQYQHMLKVLRYQELESRTMYINMGKNMRQTVKETVELLKESTEKRFFYAEGRTTS